MRKKIFYLNLILCEKEQCINKVSNLTSQDIICECKFKQNSIKDIFSNKDSFTSNNNNSNKNNYN